MDCSSWSRKGHVSVNYSLDNNSGSADFISIFFVVFSPSFTEIELTYACSVA